MIFYHVYLKNSMKYVCLRILMSGCDKDKTLFSLLCGTAADLRGLAGL